MEATAITDALDVITNTLETAGLGTIYNHVPAKPVYPCVIITPMPEFITDGDVYTQRLINLMVWVLVAPTPDNKKLQLNLYEQIPKALDALESLGALQFDNVGQPVPVEYNQVKTLAAIIEVNYLIN
mgnify:CR=1 FL=1